VCVWVWCVCLVCGVCLGVVCVSGVWCVRVLVSERVVCVCVCVYVLCVFVCGVCVWCVVCACVSE
jgi:hypothetical protein